MKRSPDPFRVTLVVSVCLFSPREHASCMVKYLKLYKNTRLFISGRNNESSHFRFSLLHMWKIGKGYSIWNPQGQRTGKNPGRPGCSCALTWSMHLIKMWGGASEIFSSLSLPEDFKWNSPNVRHICMQEWLAIYLWSKFDWWHDCNSLWWQIFHFQMQPSQGNKR